MSVKPFPAIQTERLLLRELRRDDLSALHRNWSDPATMEKVSAGCLTEEQSRHIMELLISLWPTDAGIRWGIEIDGVLAGTCGFHNLNPHCRRGELGYELHRIWWRRGIMTEAVDSVLRFGFEEMDFARVEAFTNVDNERSAGFLTSMGFTQEGILRDYEKSWRGFLDQRCFSLLRREWETKKS